MGNLCGCAPDPEVVAAANAAAPAAPAATALGLKTAAVQGSPSPPPDRAPHRKPQRPTGLRHELRGAGADDREWLGAEHRSGAAAVARLEQKGWFAIASLASELHLLGTLNSGSFARVHGALRFLSGSLRPLAVKVPKRPEDTQGFSQELCMMERACGVPHVVGFYGAEPVRGRSVFVFEWAEFGDLEGQLSLGRFGLAAAIGLMRHICLGVAGLHSRGLLHRDVKPENVLLTRGSSGRVVAKVADLGLATALPPEGTVTGFAGTPSYAAPEVLNRAPGGYGTAADVFSLGCVLYELVTAQAARVKREGRMETAELAVLPLQPDLQFWGRLSLSDDPHLRPRAQRMAGGLLGALRLFAGGEPRVLLEDLPGWCADSDQG